MARRSLAQRATPFERAVGFFAGGRWLGRRVHRRLMQEDLEYREAFSVWASARGYKAAAPGKSKTPWLNAGDRSADSEIVGDLTTLRNRARATTRDDPIGAGVVATLVRKVVGTGIRSQRRIKGREKQAEAIEEVACDLLNRVDRANNLDHAAHQRLVYQRAFEDGDVLLRAVVSSPLEPVWIEVVEGERLATPTDAEPRDAAGRIVSGVEKDRWGIPVAYWVMRRHPSEYWSAQTKVGRQAKIGAVPLAKAEFDRVPAEFCRLVRSRVTRPGQTRGVPGFHACLQDLHDLDLLLYAALRRSQVAACIAMFIQSEGDSVDLLELSEEEFGYRLDQTIEPGMMFRLFPGEKAEFLNPTAGAPDLDKFAFLFAKRIGAAVGLSPQSVLQAWEGLSYSTARTIKTGEQQTVRLERSSFAAQALCWEERVVLEDALMRGEPRLVAAGVTPDDLEERYAEYIGDEEQWVDPQAEAAATEKMLEMGLTSPQIECARLGRDWQDVTRQRLEAEVFEREQRKLLGLEESPAEGDAAEGGSPFGGGEDPAGPAEDDGAEPPYQEAA